MSSRLLILRLTLLIRQMGCCGQTDIGVLDEGECDSLIKDIVKKGQSLMTAKKIDDQQKLTDEVLTNVIGNPNELNRMLDLLETIYSESNPLIQKTSISDDEIGFIKSETTKIVNDVNEKSNENKSSLLELGAATDNLSTPHNAAANSNDPELQSQQRRKFKYVNGYELLRTIIMRLYETSNIVVFDHNRLNPYNLKKPYNIPQEFHFDSINQITSYNSIDERANSEKHQKIMGLLKATYLWQPNEKIGVRVDKVLGLYGLANRDRYPEDQFVQRQKEKSEYSGSSSDSYTKITRLISESGVHSKSQYSDRLQKQPKLLIQTENGVETERETNGLNEIVSQYVNVLDCSKLKKDQILNTNKVSVSPADEGDLELLRHFGEINDDIGIGRDDASIILDEEYESNYKFVRDKLQTGKSEDGDKLQQDLISSESTFSYPLS